MCNFCYVAFAINRIKLIGREHSSFVEYMSKVKISKYIKVSLFISVCFSFEKYFKYHINFENPESNYPISNELDIFTVCVQKSAILDFYFIFSAISDLVNYVVFVFACIIIDVVMIVKLRSVLKDHLEKFKSMSASSSNLESKASECEAVFHTALKWWSSTRPLDFFSNCPSHFCLF
jgi:hypothetical protein